MSTINRFGWSSSLVRHVSLNNEFFFFSDVKNEGYFRKYVYGTGVLLEEWGVDIKILSVSVPCLGNRTQTLVLFYSMLDKEKRNENDLGRRLSYTWL